MVVCHKIEQELSTRIEIDIEGEFSYTRNKVLELIMSVVMMFYFDYLYFNLLRNEKKCKNI